MSRSRASLPPASCVIADETIAEAKPAAADASVSGSRREVVRLHFSHTGASPVTVHALSSSRDYDKPRLDAPILYLGQMKVTRDENDSKSAVREVDVAIKTWVVLEGTPLRDNHAVQVEHGILHKNAGNGLVALAFPDVIQLTFKPTPKSSVRQIGYSVVLQRCWGHLSDFIVNVPPSSFRDSMIPSVLSKVLHTYHQLWSPPGVFHRDVKPFNILIQLVRQPDGTIVHVQPRVCDFADSKVILGGQRTLSSILIGTPQDSVGSWVSPEIFQWYRLNDPTRFDGHRFDHSDARFKTFAAIIHERVHRSTDLWSLGLVLFYAAVGQPLFKHVKHQQEFWNISSISASQPDLVVPSSSVPNSTLILFKDLFLVFCSLFLSL